MSVGLDELDLDPTRELSACCMDRTVPISGICCTLRPNPKNCEGGEPDFADEMRVEQLAETTHMSNQLPTTLSLDYWDESNAVSEAASPARSKADHARPAPALCWDTRAHLKFNREYRRLFGVPPLTDIGILVGNLVNPSDALYQPAADSHHMDQTAPSVPLAKRSRCVSLERQRAEIATPGRIFTLFQMGSQIRNQGCQLN